MIGVNILLATELYTIILKSFELFYGDVSTVLYTFLTSEKHREQGASSLVYMVDELIKESKNKFSGFYLNNYKKLADTIKVLRKKKIKKLSFLVLLMFLLDFVEQFPTKLKSTIIVETEDTKKEKKRIYKRRITQYSKTIISLRKYPFRVWYDRTSFITIILKI